MIDWINPSSDVLEAKRVGYYEACREWGGEMADLQADIQRLQAKNTEIQAAYNDYVNTENETINRLQAEIARITEEHARVWEVVREQEKTIEQLRGFPLEAVRHLARCNCSCQGNANQANACYHHSECMVGRAKQFLTETGGE